MLLIPSKKHNIDSLTTTGGKIPQIVLLPLLSQSLEEYMEEAAIKSLAKAESDLPAKLKSPESIFEFKNDVLELAQIRWEQKRNLPNKS